MSHQNTIINQILQLIPRHVFERTIRNHKAEYRSKGFSSWDQFTAMLFAQLSGQSGLRGIESGLSANSRAFYHLGTKPVRRSTLAYANENRPHEAYRELFYDLLGKLLSGHRKHRFRFKNPLYSIDASTIDLCLNLFPWAKFRKNKGGIKLHVKLDHSGYIPSFVAMTDAKTHELNQLGIIPMKKGDVVVFDRGYTYYKFYSSLCKKGIYFVTRLKKNADYLVHFSKDCGKYKNIIFDKKIKMAGFYSGNICPEELRIIESYDPDTKKTITLLTNNHAWSPKTISAIYKDRWQIEIFFKTIKQNLKIKSFYGTSENAVMTQIWISMIAYLLLKYLSFTSSDNWSVGQLMAIIPLLLFLKKDLWILLNRSRIDPLMTGPPPPQMELGF